MPKPSITSIISQSISLHGFLGHAVGQFPKGTSGSFFSSLSRANQNKIEIRFMPDGGYCGSIVVPESAVHIPSKDIFSENYKK
jgi:hypothetical protein